VSENIYNGPSSKETLELIIALLRQSIAYEDNKDLYEDIARRLSTIADKEPMWSWRYVQSVVSGTVQASKKFAHAVEIMAVTMDDTSVTFAKSEPVNVYAEEGTIAPGSFVMGASMHCATPTCKVVFVPVVPWGKYCPLCREARKKK
jgi:hypothetical protein